VGGTVKVDPDALEGLGRRLANLQARLDSLARDIGAYDAAIGAPKLKSTLSELVSWWTANRQALGQELANLGSLASNAAAQYRATEKGVTADVNRLPPGHG
jgi:hypothetical protein